MNENRPAVLTVESNSASEFAAECNKLVTASYEMKACHCATANDGGYDSLDCWKAIFVDLALSR